MTARSILVIANPAAGRGEAPAKARRLKRELWRLGARCEVAVSRSLEHVIELTRASARRPTVVAVGGDGTLGAVVDGLVRVSRAARPHLAVVPTGTGNGFAYRASLSGDLGEAAMRIASEQTQTIDVGYLPELDRHFALAVAIGMPARVTGLTTPGQKRRWGKLAYVGHAARVTPGLQESAIAIDGEALRAHTVLVVNAPLEIPMFNIDRCVASGDGALDLIGISGLRPLGALRSFLSLVRGEPRGAELFHRRLDRAVIAAEPSLDVHADGEAIGKTPVVVQVARTRLTVCAP